MLKILFLLITMLSFAANGATSEGCLPTMTIDQFKAMVQSSRDLYFPELSNLKIEISTFRSDEYFLQAQPKIRTLLRGGSKRRYVIDLNLKLLDCPPPEEALTAILVHELEHIKDYTGWSSFKIARFGVHYSTSMKLKTRYERETDHKVLEKGLHSGLAGYREWLYQWLSPKELARKKKIYLTPEEILGPTYNQL